MDPKQFGNLVQQVEQAVVQDAPTLIHAAEQDMTPQTLNFAIRVLILTSATVFIVATLLLGFVIIRDGNTSEVTNAIQTIIYIVTGGFVTSITAVVAHVAYLNKKTGATK